MKYVIVYDFEVVNALMDGKDVWVLDRYMRETYCLRTTAVEGLCDILRKAKENPAQYEFWYEEKEQQDESV